MASARRTRTDPHRPGAIVPADYEDWIDFALPTTEGGFPIPSIGVDCAQPYYVYGADGGVTQTVQPTCPDSGRCCVRSLQRRAAAEGRAIFGSPGTCGVCGAHFRRGSVFRHQPSGADVFLGHECARKYEMMLDDSALALAEGRLRASLAKQIQRSQNDRERQRFLDGHPGLAADLQLGQEIAAAGPPPTSGGRILADLQRKFVQYRSLSDKQVALASKLAAEIRSPPPPRAPRDEERAAVAPVGKSLEFEGEIVSARAVQYPDGEFAPKMTVKVTTADGSVWLAWGTVPRDLRTRTETKSYRNYDGTTTEHSYQQPIPVAELRGQRVRIRATLERPRPRDLSEFETDAGRAREEQRQKRQNFVIMVRPRVVRDAGTARSRRRRASPAPGTPAQADPAQDPAGERGAES